MGYWSRTRSQDPKTSCSTVLALLGGVCFGLLLFVLACLLDARMEPAPEMQLKTVSASELPVLFALTNFHGDVRQVVTNRAPIHFTFKSDRIVNASSFTNAVGPFVLELKEQAPDKYWMTLTPLP